MVRKGGLIGAILRSGYLAGGSEQSEQWKRAVSQAAWGIVTNKLAANTHVIGRKTQIAQCAAVGGLNQLGRLERCLEN